MLAPENCRRPIGAAFACSALCVIVALGCWLAAPGWRLALADLETGAGRALHTPGPGHLLILTAPATVAAPPREGSGGPPADALTARPLEAIAARDWQRRDGAGRRPGPGVAGSGAGMARAPPA